MLTLGKRRDGWDCEIATLALVRLNAVLGPLGSVARVTKTLTTERFVRCMDAQGWVEGYELFDPYQVEEMQR
jgi:hypothetical protein